MVKETPLILEDQKVIMDWAKKLRESNISLPTILEALITKKNYKSKTVNEGLKEVREAYNNKNSGWREQVIKALALEQHRYENDIREGEVVTDGEMVGYATNVDYSSRSFKLSVTNDGTKAIGIFSMDDYRKVR